MRHALLLAFLATSCFAEERTVPLANPATKQALQEMATVLRTVVQLKTVKIEDTPSIYVQGTPAEIDMAQWVVSRFDRPVNWRPNEQEVRNPATRTFEGQLRIFYVPGDVTPQGIQERLTILRTVLDTQLIFNFTPQQALIARGTPAELEAIEWVLRSLANEGSSEPYKLADPRFPLVRIFAMPPATTGKQMQETLTRLRTQVPIQKVFNLTSPPRLVVRATAADLDRAGDLLK